MTITPKPGSMSDREFEVDVIRREGQNWFSGLDVAASLGYRKDSRQKMIGYHVPEQYLFYRSEGVFAHLKTGPVYINDAGVRLMISKRTGVSTEAFQAWFDKKALEACSDLPGGRQFLIRNETDLHYKVVDYCKRFYPDSITIAGLGELQDTEAKRIDAKRKGYIAGQCDLLIMNSNRVYKALAIEFKHPAGYGELRENQRVFLERLQKEGCKTMVSSDYDEICRAIMAYFEDR